MHGAATERAATTSTGVPHLSILRRVEKQTDPVTVRQKVKLSLDTNTQTEYRKASESAETRQRENQSRLGGTETRKEKDFPETQTEQTWLNRSTSKKQEKPVDETESEPPGEETEREPPDYRPPDYQPTRLLSVRALTDCLSPCLSDYLPEPHADLPAWQRQEGSDRDTAQRQEEDTVCLPACDPPTCRSTFQTESELPAEVPSCHLSACPPSPTCL